jgi:hypothetical protein
MMAYSVPFSVSRNVPIGLGVLAGFDVGGWFWAQEVAGFRYVTSATEAFQAQR